MTTRRRIGILSALLLLAASAVPAITQTWSEAVAAFARGDYETAYRGFRSHAEEGNPYAQTYVGLMYYDGHGVPQDHGEAMTWLSAAAVQDDAYAQFRLSTMYVLGKGVAEDPLTAHTWLRLAAAQGLSAAQVLLGTGYLQRQELDEAAKWYRRAADQDVAIAQHAQLLLGIMYHNGDGVSQDYVRAHKWYNLAASRFPESDSRAIAVDSRNYIASIVSPSELAEAQRLAREWQPVTEPQ